MLINPFMFGATTLSTVVNYEFNGTDGDTTTTDSTGNTTASGLGIVSGSEFAYIQSNNLFAQNNYTTIDDSGALSPYLIFAGDFEIEVALSFNDWIYNSEAIIWKIQDDLDWVMMLYVYAEDGYLALFANPAVFADGLILATYDSAVVNLSDQQIFKVARVGSTISIYVNNVFKVSATLIGVVNAGRFKFWTNSLERYVDYLTVKKA